MSDNHNHSPQDATQKMGQTMMIICWVCGLLVCTYLVSVWLDRKNHPSTREANGVVEVVLQESHNHHHFSYGKINGQKVLFLVDTGASDVVIPEGLARKLGLSKGAASFAMTANGRVTVYNTKLNLLELGGIKLNNINASINPGMTGEEILLGMSALKFLEFQRAGGELILRQY